MTIEKLPETAPDITKQNIARLAELFPECVTEGPAGTASDRDEPVIDFDLLRQALSDHLVDGPQERYRLDWPGKREALLTANAPIDKTLRPMRNQSVDFDTTRNLFIEGDNLDALKLLQETYLGKVKLIFIDPPYNTGKDFVYKDNFTASRSLYELASGQRDENEGRLIANPVSNGRFHSDWLSMMFPRLKLARNLLSEDGAIFITIDDGEVDRLGVILDEIFGEDNKQAHAVWQKKYAISSDAKGIPPLHDHVLIYSRSNKFVPNLLPRTAKQDDVYTNPDNDPRGRWRSDNLLRAEFRPRDRYEIVSPKTGQKHLPPAGQSWRHPEAQMLQMIEDNRVWFGRNGDKKPAAKRFLSEVRQGVVASGWWSHEVAGHNDESKKEMQRLFEGSSPFDTPKPIRLIDHVLTIGAGPNDIVLDFFAGSGTTGHAVIAKNAADGGKRRYILVQLPEPLDPENATHTNAIELCGKLDLPHNVAALTRERLSRAGAVAEKSKKFETFLDTGFRAFRIDSGNQQNTSVTAHDAAQDALSGMISHIKDDRTEEDLLFGALLRWGVDLTLPIERSELAGRPIWYVDPPASGEESAAVLACFARPQKGKGGIDTGLADAIAALKPLRVLFRDDGFASDADKENVASRFRQLAPDTTLRVL